MCAKAALPVDNRYRAYRPEETAFEDLTGIVSRCWAG